MVSNGVNVGEYNRYQDLRIGKQAEEVNSDQDSALCEISYGPGIVRKLCARFLQLSKGQVSTPPLRSPRFKRRKISAENSFAVVGEIRRYNVTKPINENVLQREGTTNYAAGQRNNSHFTSALNGTDFGQLNGTYLYCAAVIPSGTKANRKAKTIESIREKFEKFSAAPSNVPYKTMSRVRFRRVPSLTAASTDAQNKEPEFLEVQRLMQKAQHERNHEVRRTEKNAHLPALRGTVRVVVELAPNTENPPVPLTVEDLSATPSVSSLSSCEEFQQEQQQLQSQSKDLIKIAGNGAESASDQIKQHRYQFEAAAAAAIPSTAAATSVGAITPEGQMPVETQGGEDALQEVRRLLKKFSTIREQRAKESAHQDKLDNASCSVEHHERFVQLQHVPQSQTSYHKLPASSGLNREYLEKKENLRDVKKEMNATVSLKYAVQQTLRKQREETGESGSKQRGGRIEGNHTVASLSSIPSTVVKSHATEPREDNTKIETVGIESKSTANELNGVVSLSSTRSSNQPNSETQRRSLTAKYLERKNQKNEIQSVEEPQNSEYSSAVSPTEDEGPVRQSLLSLVMDEDVPELMEAMAEKLEFVFEDLIPSVSNAGEGILRNSTTGRTRSRPKETKLEFNALPPTVFTYPDEESALAKAQWDEGEQITFQVYQELCQKEKQRAVRENSEVQRLLRPSLTATSSTDFSIVRTVPLLEEPSVAESLLGVTGRISYNSVPMDLTRFSGNAMSLIAGK